MEWLREWVMQLAGIILIGAVCDTLMADGDIKKYVKMVVGLVLVFAIVKPIVGFFPDKTLFEIPEKNQTKAVELKNRLDIKEQEIIFDLYRSKLEKSVENYIFTRWSISAKAKVTVEKDDEAEFGNIKSIILEFNEPPGVSQEEIKKYVSENFNVKPKNVKLK